MPDPNEHINQSWFWQNRPHSDADRDGISDNLEDAGDPGQMRYIAVPKTFWDKPLGRTIRAKNTAGKTMYGALTAVVAAVTGYNIQPITEIFIQNQTTMEFFTDVSFWTLLATAIAMLLGYLKARDGNKLDSVFEQARIGAKMFADYKAKESEEGTKLSPAEKERLIEQMGNLFDAVMEVIKPEIFSRLRK